MQVIHHLFVAMVEALGFELRRLSMVMSWVPRVTRSGAVGEVPIRLGHELVDGYLRFVWARARLNTLLAVGFDLKVFFTEVDKPPGEVTVRNLSRVGCRVWSWGCVDGGLVDPGFGG